METPEILQSKKFIAAALASLTSALCMRSGMSYEDTAFVVGPLIAFIGMQGVADIGKGRAKIAAAAQVGARRVVNPPIELTQEALLALMRQAQGGSVNVTNSPATLATTPKETKP
jgi:hypothetical protein